MFLFLQVLYCVKIYLHGLSTKRYRSQNDDQQSSVSPDSNRNDVRNQDRSGLQRQTGYGYEEGLTTYCLGVLVGLTEITSITARLAIFCCLLFAVFSSLFQSCIELAEPAVRSFSAHPSKPLIHHLKIVFFCAFLFTTPIYTCFLLAEVFPVGYFWLAMSTSVLTSAQVLDLFISFYLCSLFFDANESYVQLDEYIYYIRGIVKIAEFTIALFVVLLGLHEALFNPAGSSWLSIVILFVHFYFNVFQRLNQGFQSFIKRRRAVCKTNSLPNATKEQLEKLNDLCSICFTELKNESSSKVIVTKCEHFFHACCYRRWLCFKESCPMCNL